MFKRLLVFLDRLSLVWLVFIGVVADLLIGCLDYLTGHEISFSIFYLLPVATVSWYGGHKSGYLICGLSAAIWLLMDYSGGQQYSYWIIPLWNACVRLLFFVAITYLLCELKLRLKNEALMARTDGLTQIPNRRAFNEVTAKLIQVAKRHAHSVAFTYIDVDNFKELNDTYGHVQGDQVLKSVAASLAQGVRSEDVVGRLGGDEFALFMPEIGFEDVKKSIDRIHKKLLDMVEKNAWPIGFSIGVAVFPTPPASIDAALTIADRLMYRVKKSGKNNVTYEVISSKQSKTAA